MPETPDRLSNSIVALRERVENLPPKANPEVRLKLIADIRTAGHGALITRHSGSAHWLFAAADLLTRALFLRVGPRREFEAFASQALKNAITKAAKGDL